MTNNKVLIDALKEELRRCDMMASLTGERLKDLYALRDKEESEDITGNDLEIKEAKALNTTYTTFATTFKQMLASYAAPPDEFAFLEEERKKIPEPVKKMVKEAMDQLEAEGQVTGNDSEEIDHLRRWKKEAMEVYAPIHEYAQQHPDIKLGASMVSFVIDRAELYDKMQSQVTGKSAGADRIAKERAEQIEKHHRTINHDVERNYMGELVMAAKAILTSEDGQFPAGWDLTIIQKMCDKPYPERVVIAGAFLAAEYDRISADPHWEEGMKNESGEAGKQPTQAEAEREVLAHAFDKVRKLFELRSWIMDGRGNYPYDDDRYKEEVRYLYDEFDALVKDTWGNIKSKTFEYREKIIADYLKDQAGKQPEQQTLDKEKIFQLLFNHNYMIDDAVSISELIAEHFCAPEQQPADTYLDLSEIDLSEKDKLIRGFGEVTAKEALRLFLSLGLQTHFEVSVVNDPTNELYLLSFRKIDPAPGSAQSDVSGEQKGGTR